MKKPNLFAFLIPIIIIEPLLLTAQILIPPREEIAIYKPIDIIPTSSTCGLQLHDIWHQFFHHVAKSNC